MYIILSNTPPHVRPHSHVKRQTKQGSLSAQTTKDAYCTYKKGKQMQAGGFEPKTVRNLSSDIMLVTISAKSLSF